MEKTKIQEIVRNLENLLNEEDLNYVIEIQVKDNQGENVYTYDTGGGDLYWEFSWC